MLQLSAEQRDIIAKILHLYPYTFYAFGSRVKQTAKPYSDLDLCYKDAIPDYIVSEIEEAFENSDLPFKVDIVNWQQCSEEFQSFVAKDLVKVDL